MREKNAPGINWLPMHKLTSAGAAAAASGTFLLLVRVVELYTVWIGGVD